MAVPDTERRTSGWRCSKTALPEEDAMNLLKEFAELKRKVRENDPDGKRVKNKYRLKASVYPSPGNILHTGRQLVRTPGPGVLPLLPSQKFEPRELDETFEQFKCFTENELDNMVPCGKQLPRTPLYTTPEQTHVLREIQPNSKNVNSVQKLSRAVNNSFICNTTQILSNEEAVNISDNLKDRENKNPASVVTACKGMALPDTERRTSGWRCSKTALPEEDAMNLLKEFAELKRKERENDPNVKRVKNKYKLKSSTNPSPGKILHTGHQVLHTPEHGVQALPPSQKCEPQERGDETLERLRSFPQKDLNNIVPTGKQLPRTPLFTEPEQCDVLGEIHTNTKNVNSTQTANNSIRCNTANEEVEENRHRMSEISGHKETAEEVNVSSHQTRNIRRISELPVQGK
ncbi:uncharacterized protein [Pyxicephalus adspersus]|uniref:uncharacterized protein n=1 Tax=Pyxicephalus adspersus TaxID=30357 RepID=UPI003B5A0DEA